MLDTSSSFRRKLSAAMKVKEIDRIASVAWSPKELEKVYLAAGTAAGQLDSSFSTNAVLELYEWSVNEPGLDIPVKVSYTSEHRYGSVDLTITVFLCCHMMVS